MENSKVILILILGMLSLWPMVVMGSPKLHKVGGSKGWNEKTNYTQWSSQQHVYVGDWLSKYSLFFSYKFCLIITSNFSYII